MARKSQRLSSSSQAAKPTHKRVASKTATPSADAKRSKTQKATPTRSRHPPDADKDEGSTEDDEEEDAESSSPGDDEASEFGDHAADSSLSEAGEDSDSEEAPKSRKKATPSRGTSSATVIRTKSNELWRPGVSAGLGPGKQVVIKKPKARAAGKTPYQDETIHSNTLLFLKDLKANNDRQWLKMHDADFRQSERDWHSYVEKLTEKLVGIDPSIPELPVKDVIFRIYRDVRFTSDPTPYKPHFSSAWSRTGRKGPYAAYYVQVGPNESFVAPTINSPDLLEERVLPNFRTKEAIGLIVHQAIHAGYLPE